MRFRVIHLFALLTIAAVAFAAVPPWLEWREKEAMRNELDEAAAKLFRFSKNYPPTPTAIYRPKNDRQG